MEEGSGGGGGGGASSSSSSTLLSGGGRQRFEVELRPGETTIVSWKKLIKDANKAANNNQNNKAPPVPAPPVPLPVAANPALDSRIAPPSGDAAENEANDAPPGSRFSAVIEKIERLYMGKNSSDEEDLNDVPDDDEYDTEDSFIDDTELNEYFQVDNSAIKHDGFFVNRGKLERTNEPTALPSEQPKKRRRKDSAKVYGGSDDGHGANKHVKVNKKEAGKVVASVDKNTTTPSRSITLPTGNCEDVKYQSPIIALGTVVKKPSDPKNIMDSSPTRILNGEARVTAKNIDKQKTGVLQSKKHGSKLKDGIRSPALPSQRPNNKGDDMQPKSQGQIINHSEELNRSALPREKNVIHQQSDIKASEIAQQPKNAHMARKEGSSAKPKSTNLMLEKAIRDLEKIVAESRPPSMEVPEADNSSQAVKRRMPPEIKQKLAKVARLAHAIHGKLSKELINRLMSILGHLIQLRSLKRNLQNMVNMGLSAKEEKDARLQQLKKEVDEMVKIRAPMMKPKAIEQQAGSSDDFQECSTKEKVLKSRFTMDDALEDKICDLYDLYVDGLDEDAGPQVRKLYAELAEFWPKGFMDNHGIKRAICRAKDRRKALFRHKDQDNLKRKKLVAPKTEASTVDAGSVDLMQHAADKLVADSSAGVKSISNTIAANANARSSNSWNVPTMDRPKQEKLKGSSNNQNDGTTAEVLVKKKAKRKPEAEFGDAQIRHDRSTSAQGEERRKSHKQVTGTLAKPATQSSIATAAASVTSASAPIAAQPTQPTVNSSADMI